MIEAKHSNQTIPCLKASFSLPTFTSISWLARSASPGVASSHLGVSPCELVTKVPKSFYVVVVFSNFQDVLCLLKKWIFKFFLLLFLSNFPSPQKKREKKRKHSLPFKTPPNWSSLSPSLISPARRRRCERKRKGSPTLVTFIKSCNSCESWVKAWKNPYPPVTHRGFWWGGLGGWGWRMVMSCSWFTIVVSKGVSEMGGDDGDGLHIALVPYFIWILDSITPMQIQTLVKATREKTNAVCSISMY